MEWRSARLSDWYIVTYFCDKAERGGLADDFYVSIDIVEYPHVRTDQAIYSEMFRKHFETVLSEWVAVA